MHNLRNTLGRQDEGEEASLSRLGPSKIHNKSKSAQIWALDPEEEEPEKPKTQAKVKTNVENVIMGAFKKDSIFSEVASNPLEIVQSQSENTTEMDCLTSLQVATHMLSENAEQMLKTFLTSFLQCLIRRIKKLRRKQKKHELQQYDKIVQSNFKKKGAAFIDEDNPDHKEQLKEKELKMNKRPTGKDLEGSSKKNGSSSSNEGKLGKLLCNSKVKDQKKQAPQEENNAHEESVSFSAVISQNMTVRQRRGRQPAKKQKEKQKIGQKEHQKLQQGQSQGKDEAFIFFRPKAGKRK